jgi:DNA-binding NtrC family response regulator
MGQPDTASSHRETTPQIGAASALECGAVLVVEPVIEVRLHAVSTLSAAGFRVTAAEGFTQAKALLGSLRPTVLITALRLADYNGLHLVLRAKTTNPDIAALVTSPAADAVLRSDAEAMDATFVGTPISNADLVAATVRTMLRARSHAAPVRPPFERRRGQRRAQTAAVVPERRRGDRRHPLPWLIALATPR